MSAIAFNGEIYPAGARAASDQVYDNSNTGLPANVQGALDKTTGNISSLGTVELTATAAHAHAVDSTFLWIGQLVKATAAIAVGDTIAVGTNIENTDICSVLDEVNSNLKILKLTKTITSNQGGGAPLLIYPNKLISIISNDSNILCFPYARGAGDWVMLYNLNLILLPNTSCSVTIYYEE